jgi:hypothetical protein
MVTVTQEDPTMSSNAPTSNAPTRSQRMFTNTILTLIAALLLAMMLDRGQGSLIPLAQAQHQSQPRSSGGDGGGDDEGRVSAAEQRKVIIAELRNLNARMEHMESVLSKPLTVKVTEMPPVQINDKGDKKDDHKADKKQ